MLEKLSIKYLIRAHTVVGLFCIFLFYISSFFGTITFFLPYLNQWEFPSKHIEKSLDYSFNIDNKLDEIINKYKLDIKNIEILPPSFKDSRISISSKNQSTIFLNPNTNQELDTFYEYSNISEFINEIHFGENIPIIGTFLMGLASTAIIFLILTGIILFISNKKKIKEKKTPKKIWFNWHKKISLIIIPFLLIFVITGAFIGLMLNTSNIFSLSVSQYKESNLRKLVAPIIFKQKENLPSSQINSEMLALSLLYKTAKENYKNLEIRKINIYNYKKENSQIVFSGYLNNNRALSGNINRVDITLNSINAQVLSKTNLDQTHGIKQSLSAFYFLHFLPDETIGIRILFSIFGILLIASLAFGYLLWAEKKLNSVKDYMFSAFMNKFALLVIVGVLPACSLLFVLHWIIPFEIIDRDIWIKGLFYTFLCLSFCYILYESQILKIIKVLLFITGIFLFIAVFLHGYKTNIYIWNSFEQNLIVIFYVDLVLLLISFLSFFFSKKISNKGILNRFDYKRNLDVK